MKKLFAILLILLMPSLCFAAINAGTVWEVRAEGSQNFSSGFVTLLPNTSTDYSQFDSCKASWVASSAGGCSQASPSNVTNNLASTQASSWLTLTSASNNFTSAMVGNIIHITAGTNFTPGWYQITAYVDAGTVTLDRACGSTGDASGGTGYLGGAFLIGGTLDNEFAQSTVAGNTVWIKLGNYSSGEDIAFTAGTTVLPVTVEGYGANRSDHPLTTSRPTIDITTHALATGAQSKLRHLIITGTATNMVPPGNSNQIKFCKISNTSTDANKTAINIAATNATFIIGCEITSAYGYGISISTGSILLYGSYVYGGVNSKNGIYITGAGTVRSILNVFAGWPTAAMNASGQAVSFDIFNTTFYGAEGKAGIGINVGAAPVKLIGNIFYGFTSAVTLSTSELASFSDFNNYFNNTADITTAGYFVKGPNDIALNPNFVSAATGDFTPGINMKAVAFPGLFPGSGSTGYLDIGAVQRKEPTMSSAN